MTGVMPTPASLDDMRNGYYRSGTLPGLQLNYGWSPGAVRADQQLESNLFGRQEASRFSPAPVGAANYFGAPTTAAPAVGGFYGGLSSLFGAPGSSLGAPNTAPPAGTNEFGQRLAKISKNPRLDDINSRLLDELVSYKPNREPVRRAAQNQISEAAALGNRLSDVTNQSLGTLESDKSANRAVLDSFIQRFGSATPGMDASTESQTKVLDRFFADRSDPESLAAQQAGIRSRARTAESDALLPQIQRAITASQIRSGTTGVNRVNDYNLRNTAMQLGRDAAVRSAEREARDLANLTGLQRSTAGLPQSIATTNLLRSKLPMDVRLELMARESGLTGAALQQALAAQSGTTANLAAGYNLENAADPLNDLARKQAILNNSTNQFNSNNFLSAAVPGNPLPLNVPGLQRFQYPQYPSPGGYGGYGDDGGLEQELAMLAGGGGGAPQRAPTFEDRWGPGGDQPTYADMWGADETRAARPGGVQPYSSLPQGGYPLEYPGYQYPDTYDYGATSELTPYNNPISQDYNPFYSY